MRYRTLGFLLICFIILIPFFEPAGLSERIFFNLTLGDPDSLIKPLFLFLIPLSLICLYIWVTAKNGSFLKEHKYSIIMVLVCLGLMVLSGILNESRFDLTNLNYLVFAAVFF